MRNIVSPLDGILSPLGVRFGVSTLALSLFFTSATVDSSGGVTDVDGTGNSLTYTGASHKRQWNADGVLEYAPHNYMQNTSGSYIGANKTCTVTTGQTDPLGGTKAVKLDFATFQYFGQNVSSPKSTTVKCRAWIRADSAGTITFTNASSGAWSAQVNVTTSWQLFSSGVQDFGSGGVIGLVKTGSDLATVYVAFMEVREGNSPDTYIETTTSAAKYGPRVGTRNRKPITNLLSYPEQFDNAVWANVNTSESGGQSDPFGGTNAFKLIEADSAAGSAHYIRTITPASPSTWTFSFYAKAGERSWVWSRDAGGQYAFFNLATGVVGTVSSGTSGIAPVDGASGWYRCWHTRTSASGLTIFDIRMATADNTQTYDGDGTSGLYIFGAQLNEGGIEDYVGATNLATSDKAFNTTWAASGDTTVTANSAVAPDGTTTADTLADDAGGSTGAVNVRQAYTLPAAGTYNLSIFAKAKQIDQVALRPFGYDTSTSSIFSLSAGTVVSEGSGHTASISYWGNGWYRCSIEWSSSSDLAGDIYIYAAEGGSLTVDLDGTSDVYVWGAQLTKGSTLYPYVGMPQTGFTKQGYLAEASATNLVTDSESLIQTRLTVTSLSGTLTDGETLTATGGGSGTYVAEGSTTTSLNVINSSGTWTGTVTGGTSGQTATISSAAVVWTNQNTFITLNATTAPDGTTTADKLGSDGSATTLPQIFDTIAVSNATSYVYSAYVKAEEVGWVLIWNSNNNSAVWFDIKSGTVGTKQVNAGTAGVIPIGNGWFRIWHSQVTGSNSQQFRIAITDSDGNASPTIALGEGAYVWGAQLETGTYPSSYIRTSGGTEIRAADDLSETGLAYFNADEGTLIVEGGYIAGIAQDFASFTDNSNSDIIGFTGSALVRAVSSNSFDQSPSPTYPPRFKGALAYKTNDTNHAFNGVAGTTDTSVTLPTNITTLELAAANYQSADQRKWIRSLQYHNVRKSDADLATLSTITDDGTSWRKEYA